MRKIFTTICTMALLIISSTCWADIPNTMQFSGYLTGGGQPLQGNHPIVFTIYGSSDGSDFLWEQEILAELDMGSFNVILGGDDNPLDANVFGDQPLWLGLNVSGEEMSPRSPITSVPYAVRAAIADNALSEQEILNLIEDGNYLQDEADPTVNSLAKATLSCTLGQIPKWSGSLWECSDDDDTQLENTDKLAELVCGDGEIAKFSETESNWICTVDAGLTTENDPTVNVLAKANLECTENQTVKWNGTGWICADDEDTLLINTDKLVELGCEDGEIARFSEDEDDWICSPALLMETDPVFDASAAKGIASSDVSNWNAAHGWGDHAAENYLKSYTETDPVFDASAAKGIASSDVSNWNAAHGWGDHAAENYLKSYNETDPVFDASAAKGIASSDVSNWNAAHGWGDHAAENYLKSYNETDPVFDASAAKGIASSDVSNWNAAHGWGDHAAENYLKSYTETDPVFDASAAKGIASSDVSNWNAAHGWGDHAAENYLKSYNETDPNTNALGKATLNCNDGEVAKYDSGNWACAADETGGGGGGTVADAVYGDGSAGPLNISSVVSWISNPPANLNFQFTSCSISASFTVPSGTVIRCSEGLTITGTGSFNVEVAPSGLEQGIPTSPSHSNYHYALKAVNKVVAAQIFQPPINAGGSGMNGPGGSLVIRAKGAINIQASGSINANGSNATQHDYYGTGGGAGGFLIIASQTSITNAGTVSVTGGNGHQGGGLYGGDADGPGGGGGIVHMLAPTITEGTVNISGGLKSGTTNSSYGSSAAGSLGGKGGHGCDTEADDPAFPSDGEAGYLIKTVVSNPENLFI